MLNLDRAATLLRNDARFSLADRFREEVLTTNQLVRTHLIRWDGVSPLPEMKDVQAKDFYGEGYDDSDRRIPDITKAKKLLGWCPKFNVDETIEHSMAYWFDSQDRKIPLKAES